MLQVGEGFGAGKIILLGEHAVVYGRQALAAGLSGGVTAVLRPIQAPGSVRCVDWGFQLPLDGTQSLALALQSVLQAVGVPPLGWDIELRSSIPSSAGLGSSAALCVAVARAAGSSLGRVLTDEQAAAAAFEGERCFHGTPSGVDNTVAAFGGLLCFRKPDTRLRIPLPIELPLVIAHSGQQGETAAQVAGVRRRKEQDPQRFEILLDEVESLVQSALDCLARADLTGLGALLTRNHHALQSMGVSSNALDEIVRVSLDQGALGAKLTGAGGGGCALALCPDRTAQVVESLQARGYRCFVHVLSPTS